jgi:hypothetical protein
MTELNINEIINLVSYFEDFVEQKIKTIHDNIEGYGNNHTNLNIARTSLVDFIDKLMEK